MWSVVLVTTAYALWATWSTSLQPFPGSWHLLKVGPALGAWGQGWDLDKDWDALELGLGSRLR